MRWYHSRIEQTTLYMGQVITGDLHANRIILHGAWTLIADSVAASVELSENADVRTPLHGRTRYF